MLLSLWVPLNSFWREYNTENSYKLRNPQKETYSFNFATRILNSEAVSSGGLFRCPAGRGIHHAGHLHHPGCLHGGGVVVNLDIFVSLVTNLTSGSTQLLVLPTTTSSIYLLLSALKNQQIFSLNLCNTNTSHQLILRLYLISD